MGAARRPHGVNNYYNHTIAMSKILVIVALALAAVATAEISMPEDFAMPASEDSSMSVADSVPETGFTQDVPATKLVESPTTLKLAASTATGRRRWSRRRWRSRRRKRYTRRRRYSFGGRRRWSRRRWRGRRYSFGRRRFRRRRRRHRRIDWAKRKKCYRACRRLNFRKRRKCYRRCRRAR